MSDNKSKYLRKRTRRNSLFLLKMDDNKIQNRSHVSKRALISKEKLYNCVLTLFFLLYYSYLQYLLMKITSRELSLYHTIYMVSVTATEDRDSAVT